MKPPATRWAVLALAVLACEAPDSTPGAEAAPPVTASNPSPEGNPARPRLASMDSAGIRGFVVELEQAIEDLDRHASMFTLGFGAMITGEDGGEVLYREQRNALYAAVGTVEALEPPQSPGRLLHAAHDVAVDYAQTLKRGSRAIQAARENQSVRALKGSLQRWAEIPTYSTVIDEVESLLRTGDIAWALPGHRRGATSESTGTTSGGRPAGGNTKEPTTASDPSEQWRGNISTTKDMGTGETFQAEALVEPPPQIADFGVCPYEGCAYGEKFLVRRPIRLLEGPPEQFAGGEARLGEEHVLAAGEWVSSETGMTLSERRRAVVEEVDPRDVEKGLRLEQGQSISIYTYIGEGAHRAWVAGQLVDIWSDVQVQEPLRSEHWIKISTGNGRWGWTDQLDALSTQEQLNSELADAIMLAAASREEKLAAIDRLLAEGAQLNGTGTRHGFGPAEAIARLTDPVLLAALVERGWRGQ